MNNTRFIYPTTFLIALCSSGCAPRTNANVERVQNELIVLKSSPSVAMRAPTELQEADQAVGRATNTWDMTHDSQEAEHLSYLAGRRIEIAKVKTNQELAENEAIKLSRARDSASSDARGSLIVATGMRNQLAIQNNQTEIELLKNQLSELNAREIDRGLLLTLDDVLFENETAVLRPGAARKLLPLAKYILNHPLDTIAVEGHTDNIGTAEFNLNLSSRRAEAIERALSDVGVSSRRVTTKGMGEHYPIASNNTELGRSQNRRVEIVISSAAHNRIIK